jgi:hypothetical protein
LRDRSSDQERFEATAKYDMAVKEGGKAIDIDPDFALGYDILHMAALILTAGGSREHSSASRRAWIRNPGLLGTAIQNRLFKS